MNSTPPDDDSSKSDLLASDGDPVQKMVSKALNRSIV